MTSEFEIMFVHGFGGATDRPPFVAYAEAFMREHELSCAVNVHSWNSTDIDYRQPGVSFAEAQDAAEREVPRLDHAVLAVEQSERPWVLVGHSLGCFVIQKMIQRVKWSSRWCGGVFYTGAAFPWDDSLGDLALAPGARVSLIRFCGHQLKEVRGVHGNGKAEAGNAAEFQRRVQGRSRGRSRTNLTLLLAGMKAQTQLQLVSSRMSGDSAGRCSS